MSTIANLTQQLRRKTQEQVENFTTEVEIDLTTLRRHLIDALQSEESTIKHAISDATSNTIAHIIQEIAQFEAETAIQRIRFLELVAKQQDEITEQIIQMQSRTLDDATKQGIAQLQRIKSTLEQYEHYISTIITKQKLDLDKTLNEAQETFATFKRSVLTLNDYSATLHKSMQQIAIDSDSINQQIAQEYQLMQQRYQQTLAHTANTIEQIEEQTTSFIRSRTTKPTITAVWAVCLLMVSIVAGCQVNDNYKQNQALQQSITQQQSIINNLKSQTPATATQTQAMNLLDIRISGDSVIISSKYPARTTTQSKQGFTQNSDTMTIKIK